MEQDASYNTVQSVYLGVGICSVLATALVTYVFVSSRRMRKDHASNMIQVITLCDLCYTLKFLVSAIVYFSDKSESGTVPATTLQESFHFIEDDCATAAAYGQFWGMTSICWNACWCFDYLCVLVNPMRNTSKQRRWYHMFVWAAAGLSAVEVILQDEYAEYEGGVTCWERADQTRFLVFLIPLLCSILLALGSLFYALFRLNAGTAVTRVNRRSIFTRHVLYVWFFLFLWMWPALHRLAGTVSDIPFLDVMDAITVSGQAFVMAVIRLSEPSATSALKRTLWRLRPCCCRASDPPECLRAPLVTAEDGRAKRRSTAGGGGGSAGHEADAMAEVPDSWDFGAKLRLEQAMCMLSGMCQALAVPEEWAPRSARVGSGVHAAVGSIAHAVAAAGGAPSHTAVSFAAAGGGGGGGGAAGAGASAARADAPDDVPGVNCSPASSASTEGEGYHVLNPLAAAAERTSPLTLPAPLPVPPPQQHQAQSAAAAAAAGGSAQKHTGEARRGGGGGGGGAAAAGLGAAADDDGAAAVLLRDISALMASASTVSKLCAPLFDFSMDTLGAAMSSAKPVDVMPRPPRARSIRHLLGRRGSDATSGGETSGGEMSGGESDSSGGVVRPSPRTAPEWGRPGTQFELTAFCADQFKRLRDAAGVSERRIVDAFSPRGLVTRSLHAHFSDGASSSFFCKSADGSLVVKTLEAFEVVTLIDMLPSYVAHLTANRDSLLCRFYGCFAMQAHKAQRVFFVVMGNVFPVACPDAIVFDLKGSTVGRRVDKKNTRTSSVLKDSDFRDMFPLGLRLQPGRRDIIVKQLRADIDVMVAKGLMDYSLLVSIVPRALGGPPGSVRRSTLEDNPLIDETIPPALADRIGVQDETVSLPQFSALSVSSCDQRPVLRAEPGAAAAAAAAAGNGGSRRRSSARGGGGGGAAVDAAPVHGSDLAFSNPVMTAAAAQRVLVKEPAGEAGLLEIGLIDMLQTYDMSKRIERNVKRLRHMDLNVDVSSLNAVDYANRFDEMVDRAIFARELTDSRMSAV